ncbi:TetR family transcriptional regulator [Solimonas sp. K1W22B-7]|uniref:TetR family transcriptional regulator n=1 Tax=Solimonas sp. K1W22B-7 TaxID=2303331 RepID=UPI0013C4758E|nr:TetR family transcriptional regulator [Solimonas sp. K1W22B-7]
MRQRKKNELRERLVAVTVELVGERGLDGFTVDEIAARAGVGRATFFRYFESLNAAIVVGFYEQRLRAMVALVHEAPAALGPVDTLGWMFDRMVALHHQEQAAVLRQFLLLQSSKTLQAIALQHQATVHEEVLAEALLPRFGRLRKDDLRPRILVSATLAAIRSMADIWAQGGGRMDLQKMMRQVIRQLKEGFGAD